MRKLKIRSAKTNKLQEWMHKERWTNRLLADELGLDENYVGLIARGDRPVSPGFRLAFATRFGWDLQVELFGPYRTKRATQVLVLA